MQREIKFRGQHIYNKKWVYGYLVIFNEKWQGGIFTNHIQLVHEDGSLGLLYRIIPETVGQYTGLNDKNGKEIYEADIVKFNNNDADLCQICFGEFPVYDMETEESIDTACGWYGKVIATDALSQIEPFCYDRVIDNQWIGTLDIEVIDNIYDDIKYLNQPQEDTNE